MFKAMFGLKVGVFRFDLKVQEKTATQKWIKLITDSYKVNDKQMIILLEPEQITSIGLWSVT